MVELIRKTSSILNYHWRCAACLLIDHFTRLLRVILIMGVVGHTQTFGGLAREMSSKMLVIVTFLCMTDFGFQIIY